MWPVFLWGAGVLFVLWTLVRPGRVNTASMNARLAGPDWSHPRPWTVFCPEEPERENQEAHVPKDG